MAVNKMTVTIAEGEQLGIDLTGDTVAPETLNKGVVAHDASGNTINVISNNGRDNNNKFLTKKREKSISSLSLK